MTAMVSSMTYLEAATRPFYWCGVSRCQDCHLIREMIRGLSDIHENSLRETLDEYDWPCEPQGQIDGDMNPEYVRERYLDHHSIVLGVWYVHTPLHKEVNMVLRNSQSQDGTFIAIVHLFRKFLSGAKYPPYHLQDTDLSNSYRDTHVTLWRGCPMTVPPVEKTKCINRSLLSLTRNLHVAKSFHPDFQYKILIPWQMDNQIRDLVGGKFQKEEEILLEPGYIFYVLEAKDSRVTLICYGEMEDNFDSYPRI